LILAGDENLTPNQNIEMFSITPTEIKRHFFKQYFNFSFKYVNITRISNFRIKLLNRHYLSRIYLIFIRPMLEYACELWDGCSQQDSDNLEKLQIEAGRIVTGLPLFASRQSIYSETGWELLSDRRRVRRLSLFYSIHNKSAPDYLCDLIPLPVGSVSQYNLRNSNNYVLPNCRLEITKKSFFPLLVINYQSLLDYNHPKIGLIKIK
jgi:hypothetical protein